MLKNQKGFTLIEIIAVLVILGILAAVAVPKYMDVQGDARGKALSGALAALQSTATLDYSKGLLNGAANYNSTSGPDNNTGVIVGDYTGSWTVSGNVVTVTVTAGPTNWDDAPATYNRSKDFTIR